MSEALTGWVHGKTVSLDSEAPEFEGRYVEVVLKPIEEPRPAPSTSDEAVSRWTGETEMRWLREHGSEYSGRWVALDGDRLVAVGEHARDVYAEAHAEGIKTPFVTLVESDEPFIGGWL